MAKSARAKKRSAQKRVAAFAARMMGARPVAAGPKRELLARAVQAVAAAQSRLTAARSQLASLEAELAHLTGRIQETGLEAEELDALTARRTLAEQLIVIATPACRMAEQSLVYAQEDCEHLERVRGFILRDIEYWRSLLAPGSFYDKGAEYGCAAERRRATFEAALKDMERRLEEIGRG
jgi:hypothetical protein